jgi:glycosyltransferase involved in cell wall biosynthesis
MISVVTITYNNYIELMGTLRSLEQQSVEMVVVNGGDCLRTKYFLENGFDGVYVSEPDRGISDAFSKGVRLASSSHICFLNSGDLLIDEDYFSSVGSYIVDNYDLICCDNIHSVDGVGELYKKCNLKFPNMPYNHQGLIVKKKLIEKTNFFDDGFRVAMDFDSIVKITRKYCDLRVYYYKKAVVLMDGGGVSHSQNYIGEMEKLRSLYNNRMLSARFVVQLCFQYIKAQTKRFLICVGLVKIVNLYKRIINKQV